MSSGQGFKCLSESLCPWIWGRTGPEDSGIQGDEKVLCPVCVGSRGINEPVLRGFGVSGIAPESHSALLQGETMSPGLP